MFKSSTRVMLAALAVMAMSATAFAADAPAKSEVKDLARVEVTGSRIAESIEELPAQAYVVTREEIEDNGIRNVQEALTRIPGISMDPYASSMTHEKRVKIRGLGMEVLLLVDGVPYMTSSYTAGNNAFDLNQIPVEDVERIEVVKGASSAVYGSAAAGGVINIITREGAEKTSATVKVESGSNGWFRGLTRGTVVTENGLKATLGYTKTRETGNAHIEKYDDGSYRNADDYDANAYNVAFEKGAWSLTGDWGNAEAKYFTGNKNVGPIDGNEGKYARVALNYNDGVNVARIYYNNDYKEYPYPASWSKNSYDNDAWGATFNRKQEIWGHNFVYGLDFREEKFVQKDWTAGPEKTIMDRDRTGIAPYIETTIALGAINMDLGLRYEHWSVDKADDVDEFIPRVSFNYETESGKLLYATAGRYFMMPSFYQMSYEEDDWMTGAHHDSNPNLAPEKGWTYDLGIKDMKAKNPWSLNLFYMTMDDKIAYNYWPIQTGVIPGGPTYINVSEYRAYGFEGQYTWNIDKVWSVTPGIAYLHAEERLSSGAEWKRPGDPRWDISTYVNYKKGEWKSELGLHYYDDRELGSKVESNEAIFLADFSLVWTPEKLEGNTFRFACTNIFDKEYYISYSDPSMYGQGHGYVTPERRFVISWERQF